VAPVPLKYAKSTLLVVPYLLNIILLFGMPVPKSTILSELFAVPPVNLNVHVKENPTVPKLKVCDPKLINCASLEVDTAPTNENLSEFMVGKVPPALVYAGNVIYGVSDITGGVPDTHVFLTLVTTDVRGVICISAPAFDSVVNVIFEGGTGIVLLTYCHVLLVVYENGDV
jgi:hypothetical protein